MHQLCFAACVALMLGLSVRAEEKPAAKQEGFPKRANPRAGLIQKFDKDGDGKLNEEERAAMREEMRKNREKAFDKNGDGKLDDTERAAMQEARKAREKAFDKDGDGKLSIEERKAMREELMKNRRGGGPGKGRPDKGKKKGPPPAAPAAPGA